MITRLIKVAAGEHGRAGNAAIQVAVDEMARQGGGTVELPAGTFDLAGAVMLRSGVSLIGQGPATILQKAPSVSSPLCGYACYNNFEVEVERADLFRPGMGILIQDLDGSCIYSTVASVVERRGGTLYIDRPLNHDYNPAREATASSLFPLVWGEGVRKARLAGLVLDGGDDSLRMNGCRGGGAFLWDAHDVAIEDVEVCCYNGDAVSFQRCTDVLVRRCHLHHNAGCGLHPGCGSVRYCFEDNDVHHNGGDGLYYCLATTHSLCQGNRLHNNAGVGISVGERDIEHLIRANEVRGNGRAGVEFRAVQYRGGDRVVLVKNTLAGNCTVSGTAEVTIPDGVDDVVLRGNIFENLKGKALAIGPKAQRIHLIGNLVGGRPCGAGDVEDPGGVADFGEPDKPLRVGPAAAGRAAARHLGIGELPPLPKDFPTS